MSRTRVVFGACLLLLLGGALQAAAQSQATTGVIEGVVTESGGGAVPGATVTLRNTATNFEQTVASGADGRFRALLLPLGPYRITVALEGFSTVVREGVDLAVGQTLKLVFELQVATVAQ